MAFVDDTVATPCFRWVFLQQHPSNTPVGGFKNPPGHISGPYYDTEDSDNRGWLAAELFRTTCNSTFVELQLVVIIRVQVALFVAWFVSLTSGNPVSQGTPPNSRFSSMQESVFWAGTTFRCMVSKLNGPISFQTALNMITAITKAEYWTTLSRDGSQHC